MVQQFIKVSAEDSTESLLDYLYQPEDSNIKSLWASVCNDKAYYYFSEEIELVNEFSVKDFIPSHPYEVIDFGPGSEESIINKTITVINQLKTVKMYSSYDLNDDFTQNSQSLVAEHFPQMIVRGKTCDFFHTNIIKEAYSDSFCKVGLLFGGTLANVSENLVEKLRFIRNSLGKNSYFLLSQDCNNDEFTLRRAYDNATGRNFSMNVLDRIGRAVNSTEICSDNYEFEYSWSPNKQLVESFAVAKHNHTFSYKNGIFSIQKGQRLSLYRCYKYSIERYQNLAQEAGFSPVTVYKRTGGKLALHLWRT